MWQVNLAVVDNRHAATVDQELLEVPANVVRLQTVVCQQVFLGERHDR